MTDHTFSDAVKRGVTEYLTSHNLKKSGNWELYAKAILFIPLAAVIYFYILIGDYALMTGILLYMALGATFSMVAVNVMHDACHGSFSEKRWINDLMGLTMNAIGSNAYLWKIRHTIHHTFTNIEGIDHDIDNWPMLRQSPTQGWRPFHRYQYLYMFLIYALSTMEWMLVSDFNKYFTRKVSSTEIRKISMKEHIIFWASKIIGAIAFILLPIYFLGWEHWLLGFIIVHFTMGLSITIIFQLAHVVENTHFEEAGLEIKQIPSEWAVHEVITTSNFGTQNKILSWFAGGLNFQIEHHLFPFFSHVHYPAISDIIRRECARHHLPYHCYPTLGRAFLSHIHFMKQLGRKP